MKKTIFLIATFLFVILPVSAKLTITRTTCNYQQGLAISKGDIRVGWQLSSDTQGERQTAYEIRVFENITNKKIFSSGKIKSDKSQLISLPSLPANTHGYCWDVRVWNMKGEKSAFSKRQIIRIVPQTIDARWVGGPDDVGTVGLAATRVGLAHTDVVVFGNVEIEDVGGSVAPEVVIVAEVVRHVGHFLGQILVVVRR